MCRLCFSFFFLAWIKPNILWICLRPTFKPVNLTEAAAGCIILYLGSKWMTRHHCRPYTFNHLASHKHLHTEKTHSFTSGKLTISVPSCREGSSCSSLLCLVWFSIWFSGLLFNFLAFYGLFFFFCPDSLFLYLIKIWKLNFHSIFSNHLIKISSTTTKKIRSSCSK